MSDTDFNSNSEDESDLVVIDYNHVGDYNPDQILPQSPETLQKIREWLAPTAYDLPSGEFRKHLATHMAGTGSWITSDQTYETWIKGTEDGLLWIQGVPGSGKSVVAASLIEQLRHIEPNCVVLFFFFRQIIDANHKPQALLRDWMHQILDTSPVLQHKLAGYIEQRRSMDQMGMDDLWSDLRMAFSASSSKIFCIVDALDEMDQGYDTFITTLGRLGRWRPEKVKVLMTSRPVPKLEPPLRVVAPKRLRLQADEVDRDIATFVYHSLEKSSIPKDDWHKVTSAVPGRANGIFLYAKLAMDAFLEDGAHLDTVLSQLPEDLNVLYTKLLEEHAKRSTVSSETQRLILQSVTHARRPLRLLELAEMVLQSSKEAAHGVQTLKESKDLVRAACGPLLEILPYETVSVIHHSFTEYLKGTTRSNAEFHNYPALEPGATHDELARACLQYLLSGCLRSVKLGSSPTKRFQWRRGLYDDTGSPEISKVTLKYPFAKYAVNNWAYHVRQSEAAEYDQQDSCALIATFLNNDVYKKAWLELAWPDTYNGALNVTNLHIAGQVGLSAYTRSLLATTDVDPIDGQGKSPL